MSLLNNILITGTPCSGKSTVAKKVAEISGWEWINISDVAKRENLIESFDETLNCPVIDEDEVVDFLEPRMMKGKCIIEYHGCGFFPEDWFRSIFVLRTETSYLYDRLVARGYSGRKLNDNMECEIFQVILEEANDTFDSSIIQELQNNIDEDLDKNVQLIASKL
ncbi:unnamed protein product [Nesidiocoris tenuis]|uniref:Adenylate kinase isoenzyme 6 homolog n=2 Tax=Nesidiocoris tenuis TaxID=355587 RepID=A0A6H5G6L7_9HEMI|nr:Adenylate kinase isoenzyme [Nesidiocoris tenuis]CAA9997823.1 unnamed protein product [Nesidiocoris tenuis]